MPRASPDAESSSLRRSTRAVQRKTYIQSDSDSEIAESDDQSEIGEESEDEYLESKQQHQQKQKAKQKARTKGARVSASARKKSKTGVVARADGARAGAVPEDFEENYLYESLSQPESSIQELTLEWIEAFEKDQTHAITQLVNLSLRCCGCCYLLQPHDLANLESANETMGEVQIAFELQKSHEYPFVSNNKDLKFFRKNVLEFFQEIISLSHEKGLLYKDSPSDEDEEAEEEDSLSSSLMNNILTWFVSMSTLTARPLRYVATALLLTIQSQLCDVVVKIISSQEKSQRQLNNSKKSSTTKKIKTITNTIQTYHHQIDTVKEYLNDVIETVFIHRYRDIDPLIRQECVKHLGEWMIIYPQLFFQSSHLRYFGWLLSDPSNHVRSEVSKVLLKLYKGTASTGELSVGFRQFTERFKKQMIKMSWNDQDSLVKLNLISCLIELQKIGFLEEVEVVEVSLELYQLSGSNTKTINKKWKFELAKFIAQVNSDEYTKGLETFSIYISSLGDGTDKKEMVLWFIKVRYLINFLKKSYEFLESNVDNIKATSEIFEHLYQLPLYSKSWQYLIKYLFYDFADLGDNELKEFLELSTDSESDKLFLLNFILGAMNYKKSTPIPQTNGSITDDETYESILLQLANLIPNLQNILIRSLNLTKIYLKLWNLLISENQNLGIYSTFKNLGQLSIFDQLCVKLLNFYQNYELKLELFEKDEILQSFDEMFSILLANYESTSGSPHNGIVLPSETRIAIQNTIAGITAECKYNLSQIFVAGQGDSIAQFQSGGVEIYLNLIKVSGPLFKLNLIGEFINLNEFKDVLEFYQEMISKVNLLKLNKYLTDTPTNFSENEDKIVGSFKMIFDFFLTLNSWKLEKLTSIPSSLQGNYDLFEIFVSLSSTLKLEEKLLRESTSIKLNVKNKINDSINKLQTLFGAKFIDLLVSMKIFYAKLSNSNQFKNFSILNEIGESYFVNKVNEGIEMHLLDIFLYKEATAAGFLGIELDRNDEENVNLGDFGNEEYDTLEVANDSRFGDNGEGDDATIEKRKQDQLKQIREHRIWDSERDLCVFMMKLFSLINISMVHGSIRKRIELNNDKFGGLVQRIVKQNQPHINVQPSVQKQTQHFTALEKADEIQIQSDHNDDEMEVDNSENGASALVTSITADTTVNIEDTFVLED